MFVPLKYYTPEEQQKRWKIAMQEVFDIESVLLGLWPLASGVERNVFDSEDGVRLVCSRESAIYNERPCKDQPCQIHVIACPIANKPLHLALKEGRADIQEFCAAALEFFEEISGLNAENLEFLGVAATTAFPHFIMVPDPYREKRNGSLGRDKS